MHNTVSFHLGVKYVFFLTVIVRFTPVSKPVIPAVQNFVISSQNTDFVNFIGKYKRYRNLTVQTIKLRKKENMNTDKSTYRGDSVTELSKTSPKKSVLVSFSLIKLNVSLKQGKYGL